MQGIVYRDLKPENLLLAAGMVKLADFGTAIDMRHERPISRLVSTHTARGSCRAGLHVVDAVSSRSQHGRDWRGTAGLTVPACLVTVTGQDASKWNNAGPPALQGTVQYMPPEVLRCPDRAWPDLHKERQDLAYGVQADVWALGILLHELLLGRTPFQHSTVFQTAQVRCAGAAMTSTKPGLSIQLPASILRLHVQSKAAWIRFIVYGQ